MNNNINETRTETAKPCTFTREQLEAAFNTVRNPRDWKARIFKAIPVDQVPLVCAAIQYFTATEATVEYVEDGTGAIVSAAGYRAGPAGDN